MTNDHSGYYETCARARTYDENVSKKNFCLEHTKPLFNKNNILNIYNLYRYHTFLDVYRILKTHTPISLFSLFTQTKRDANFTLHYPPVKLGVSMRNFLYSSCVEWNGLIDKVLERNLPNKKGIVIEGSVNNSDFCATLPFVKKKLKTILLENQNQGNSNEWGQGKSS